MTLAPEVYPKRVGGPTQTRHSKIGGGNSHQRVACLWPQCPFCVPSSNSLRFERDEIRCAHGRASHVVRLRGRTPTLVSTLWHGCGDGGAAVRARALRSGRRVAPSRARPGPRRRLIPPWRPHPSRDQHDVLDGAEHARRHCGIRCVHGGQRGVPCAVQRCARGHRDMHVPHGRRRGVLFELQQQWCHVHCVRGQGADVGAQENLDAYAVSICGAGMRA